MDWAVIVSDAAEADLLAIHRHIAERASDAIALRFIERIEQYCRGFETMPERGMKRDDLRPGLRTVGFRRRATILFEVHHRERKVIIHGVSYAGRSFEGAAWEEEEGRD